MASNFLWCRWWCVAAMLGSVAWPLQAQETPAAAPAQAPTSANNSPVAAPVLVVRPVQPVGQATQTLLHLQREGQMASPLSYSMPHAVASKVYERYVNSFAHPIPERLDSIMESER